MSKLLRNQRILKEKQRIKNDAYINKCARPFNDALFKIDNLIKMVQNGRL